MIIPTKAQIELLKKAGNEINPEWVTFILLSHDAGFSKRTRHLKCEDREGDTIRRKARGLGQPLIRTIPTNVLEHLDRLEVTDDYFCPWLHSLSRYRFNAAWKQVQQRAKCKVRLEVLGVRYRKANQAAISREKRRAERGDLMPSPETIERLKAAGTKINRDWVTFILLVHGAGIVARTARHLKRTDQHGDEVYCKHAAPGFSNWRRLPAHVLRHVNSLPSNHGYFCPWLHSLTADEIKIEWGKVEKRAKIRVPLNALSAPYRAARQQAMEEQRTQAQRNPIIDDETLELLKHVGVRLNSDWVTFILLTHDAGIIPAIARRLKRTDRIGNKMICQLKLRQYPIKRELPDNVVRHLDSLGHKDEHYCPWLNSLSSDDFCSQWERVQRNAQKVVPLRTLCFAYRSAHRAEIKWERAEAILEVFAEKCCAKEKWLTREELEEIHEAAKRWARLPAKNRQRNRRKTRKQLLAGVSRARKQSAGRAEASIL